MESKVCSRCKKELPIEEFIGAEGIEFRSCNRCREIGRRQQLEYKRMNPDKIKCQNIKYKEAHREELRVKANAYYYANRESILEKQRNSIKVKEYRKAHKEDARLRTAKYRKSHPELKVINAIKAKEYRQNNKEYVLARDRAYAKKAVSELRDWYVRVRLETRGFSPNDITSDLIELEKANILLKRLIKSYENETN